MIINNNTAKILIAGGGIAGIASAIGLARNGHQVDVVEQTPTFEETGAGLQLGPNAVRALKTIDAWQAVEPYSFSPQAIHIHDGQSGTLLRSLPLANSFYDRFGAPYRVIHRADLLAGLLQTAQTIPAIALHTGRRIEKVRFIDNQAVTHFTTGDTYRPTVLIGADGIHSVVRRAVVGNDERTMRHCQIFRGLSPLSNNLPDSVDKAVNIWLIADGHIITYPISAGKKLNIIAVTKNNRARDMVEAFGPLPPLLRDSISGCQTWLQWPGSDRQPIKTWHRHNTLLIGDAAHPTLPFLAQGAAMALEDAAVLMKLTNDRSVPECFAKFNALRQPRTARLTILSRQQGRIDHLSGVARKARNTMIKLLPPEKQFSRLAWIYNWHPTL